ncbi:MAG: HEAT repeat domain-containing protein [Leptolyngbya sp. Prado105]|nr:HEAT repeat domain-containing protein [Leptolyngbya sp. Prado105]
MQKLNYNELLDRAHTSARRADWEQLSQDLQLLLSGDESAGETVFSDPNTTIVLLDLAMQVLESGDFQERWEVAKIFPNFGIDALPPLIELLQDSDADPESQWFAIRILGGFNHPRVVETLVELLKTSQSEELNSMAVSVLANLGSTAIAVLEELLGDNSTRLFGVQALGQIRRSETIPLLMQVVQDRNSQVRAIAIEALSSFHSAEITAILITALEDVAVPVRLAAVAGLGFCQGDDLVSHLRPLLFDLNLEVCRQSAIALGRLATPEAARVLYEALKSPHTPENLAIDLVRALGWIPLTNALIYLESVLVNCSEAVQFEIVQTLGRVEEKLRSQATAILLAFHAQSPIIRQAIALSLGQLGDSKAIDPLIAMLADPDEGVRLHVISALKTLDAEVAYQRLGQIEAEGSELGRGIAIALQEWG